MSKKFSSHNARVTRRMTGPRGRRPITPTGGWVDGSNIPGVCGNPGITGYHMGNTVMATYTEAPDMQGGRPGWHYSSDGGGFE